MENDTVFFLYSKTSYIDLYNETAAEINRLLEENPQYSDYIYFWIEGFREDGLVFVDYDDYDEEW